MDYESPEPRTLSSLAFALAHQSLFDQYVALRVQGYHSSTAFRSVFDEDWADNGSPWRSFNAVEFNPYVVSRLRDGIAKCDPRKMWNPRIAVHDILSLARDPAAKDATRLAAMKELNILLSITIVDENGKTKAVDMSAFYRDVEQVTHEIPSPTPSPTEEAK